MYYIDTWYLIKYIFTFSAHEHSFVKWRLWYWHSLFLLSWVFFESNPMGNAADITILAPWKKTLRWDYLTTKWRQQRFFKILGCIVRHFIFLTHAIFKIFIGPSLMVVWYQTWKISDCHLYIQYYHKKKKRERKFEHHSIVISLFENMFVSTKWSPLCIKVSQEKICYIRNIFDDERLIFINFWI